MDLYYLNNTEKKQKSVYDRRNRIKEWYRSLKVGKKCKKCKIVCKLKKIRKFHFHHKNPENKEFNVSDGVSRGYSIKVIKKELKKTTFLCDDCHFNQ